MTNVAVAVVVGGRPRRLRVVLGGAASPSVSLPLSVTQIVIPPTRRGMDRRQDNTSSNGYFLLIALALSSSRIAFIFDP
jgi:hypothetical protein